MSTTLNIRDIELPLGEVGAAYNHVVSFYTEHPDTNTYLLTQPINFAVLLGALPDGLTIDSDGRITGTPTVVGIFSFVLEAETNDEEVTIDIPLTIIITNIVTQLILDSDPLPICLQKGIEYSTAIRIIGGVGKGTATIAAAISISGFNHVRPQHTEINLLSAEHAKFTFNIPNEGTYYVNIVVTDALNNTNSIILQLVIASFCSDKPQGTLSTSPKSPPVMVKESWHQKNMITFLPDVLRS